MTLIHIISIILSSVLQIESIAQGASVSFKKRKTATAAAPTSSNISESSTADAVKVEPNNEETLQSSISSSSALVSSADGVAAPAPVNVAAPVPAAAVVVSMKIGNMQGGGAKRKFRVREPSPP